MAFVPVPDVVAVEVRCTLDGEPVENTYYYLKTTGGVTQANVDGVAETVDGAVAEFMFPLWNNQVTYIETYVRDLSSQVSFQATNNTSTGQGTRLGNFLPARIALVVNRESGLVGREARGHVKFFGQVLTDIQTPHDFTAAYANAVVAGIEDLVDVLVTVGAGVWVPVIVSRHAASLAPGDSQIFEIVEWRYANVGIDSLRGR